jgi:hypothetical protein
MTLGSKIDTSPAPSLWSVNALPFAKLCWILYASIPSDLWAGVGQAFGLWQHGENKVRISQLCLDLVLIMLIWLLH